VANPESTKKRGPKSRNPTHWKPGQSGNPGGLRKSSVDARRLWSDLCASIEAGESETNADRLIRRYLEVALSGKDVRVLLDAINRLLGKVPDRVEVKDDRAVRLDWGDVDLPNAPAASGPAPDPQTPGEVQGGDLRPPLGEDEVGRG